MRVLPIPCLSDNYAYLVVCPDTNEAAIVDASEAEPVAQAVLSAKVKVAAIWSTHHHWDHVGGNEELAKRYGVDVYGHASDKGRLAGQTRFVESGERLTLGNLGVLVHHIPGHTLGAIAYVVEARVEDSGKGRKAVFTGDTMFVAGCGRLFEGTPQQMQTSLEWLASLDPETQVFCGHEYTEKNLAFAAHVEPSNAEVTHALAAAKETRAAGKPTVPSRIAEERKTNPFLRVDSPEIRQRVGIAEDADAATAFAAVRKAKDGF